MTEASTAQINARIAHIRLVYGDADQDAALLEALLKDRETLAFIKSQIEAIAAHCAPRYEVQGGTVTRKLRDIIASQPAPTAYRAVPKFTSGRASDTAPVGQPAQQVQPGAPITLTYTNWKGETAQRTIIPRRVWWGSTEWHPEPQWLLTAFDVDKEAERDFALKDFGQPLTVQDAARVVADAINKDMHTFNKALASIPARPEMPVQHFFSMALKAYAEELHSLKE